MAIVKHHKYGLIQVPDSFTEADINNVLVKMDAELGEQYGIGETLFRAAERGFTSTARGLEQTFTDDIEQGLGTDTTDLEKERELRVMLEQNPVSGYSALLLGSLADPVTLPFAFTKLIKSANLVAQGATRAGAGGAVGGLLEPTYDEFGDSTVMNILYGTGFGAGLGAVAGKVLQRAVEGPSIKVEGDEEGIIVPESIKRDGKLRDEVFQAFDDVELASIQARVGANLQESGAIEDVQKLAEGLPIQRLAEPPTPAARVFNPVEKLKEELTPSAAKALPRKEVQTLQNTLGAVTRELEKAKAILGRRKAEAPKARAQATVDKIQKQQAKIQTQLTEAQEAAKSQRYINILNSGKIEQLPKIQKDRLAVLQQEAGADLTPVLSGVAKANEPKLAEPVEQALTALNAKIGERLSPIETKPARIPLGLDPLPGVGSTGTRPGGRFEATSPDAPGTEAVRKAVRGRKVPEQDRFTVTSTDAGTIQEPTQIVGKTQAEQNFHSRLQAESSEQLARLRNETTRGRYTWDNISKGAVEVENRILEDYDDLASWLAENETRIKTADELEALIPLIQEAQQRMFDARRILIALDREGKIDSEEGLRVMQDIQYYNYISNAAYIAEKTKISNAMTQLRRMKKEIELQEGQLARGETINKLMFGVKC